VANYNSDTASILLNTTATGATTPTFATKVDLATGSSPRSVSIGDINGDGKPDLAVADYFSNSASILLNTTATGATTPTFATKVDFTTGIKPQSVSDRGLQRRRQTRLSCGEQRQQHRLHPAQHHRQSYGCHRHHP
jgi:FG-GAP repeat.